MSWALLLLHPRPQDGNGSNMSISPSPNTHRSLLLLMQVVVAAEYVYLLLVCRNSMHEYSSANEHNNILQRGVVPRGTNAHMPLYFEMITDASLLCSILDRTPRVGAFLEIFKSQIHFFSRAQQTRAVQDNRRVFVSVQVQDSSSYPV